MSGYLLIGARTWRVTEYVYCSNRGVCSFTAGSCDCYSGFLNANCDTYNYGVREITSLLSTDILNLQSRTSGFTGNVLKLSTTYPGTTAFNYITVSDATRDPIFNLDGYGNINMNYGGLYIGALDGAGGQTIAHGGLTVTGGCTISGGITVVGPSTFSSGGINVGSGGLTVTGGGTLSVTTGCFSIPW